jgi:hypothetical protein
MQNFQLIVLTPNILLSEVTAGQELAFQRPIGITPPILLEICDCLIYGKSNFAYS